MVIFFSASLFLFFRNEFIVYIESHFFDCRELFCECSYLGFDSADETALRELHAAWLAIHMSQTLCLCCIGKIARCMIEVDGGYSIGDSYHAGVEFIHPCEIPWSKLHIFWVIVSVEQSFYCSSEDTCNFWYTFIHAVDTHGLVTDASLGYAGGIFIEIGEFHNDGVFICIDDILRKTKDFSARRRRIWTEAWDCCIEICTVFARNTFVKYFAINSRIK